MAVLFFFNDTATTEIYTLSLHDALPILSSSSVARPTPHARGSVWVPPAAGMRPSPTSGMAKTVEDRKSTRLNSSHLVISYAVFCLKKKKNIKVRPPPRHHLPVLLMHPSR